MSKNGVFGGRGLPAPLGAAEEKHAFRGCPVEIPACPLFSPPAPPKQQGIFLTRRASRVL